jgi:hypothetical protein
LHRRSVLFAGTEFAAVFSGRIADDIREPLQCFQIFDEVRLLPVAETEIEQRIVMIHHCEQIDGTAIMEVRRMLPERT